MIARIKKIDQKATRAINRFLYDFILSNIGIRILAFLALLFIIWQSWFFASTLSGTFEEATILLKANDGALWVGLAPTVWFLLHICLILGGIMATIKAILYGKRP